MAGVDAYVDQWEAEGRPYRGEYYVDPKPLPLDPKYVYMVQGDDGEWHFPR